jgi:hypothetical protein
MENEKGQKTYNIYRASMYDPRIKRQIGKHFNLSKISLEEAKQKGTEWKNKMKIEIQEELNKNKSEIEKPISKFKFKLDDYSGSSFLMIGSTKSGKTYALNWMLNHTFFKKEEKYINMLFSNSLQSNVYNDILKNKSLVSSLFYHPKAIKEAYQINRETKNKYRFNIILDDIVDEKYDKELMKLLTIYRNSRISAIIVSQELSINNSISRSNINFIMLFYLNSDSAIEKVIKAYLLSYYPTKMKMIDKIKQYRKDTENHVFYFINNLENTVQRCKINN